MKTLILSAIMACLCLSVKAQQSIYHKLPSIIQVITSESLNNSLTGIESNTKNPIVYSIADQSKYFIDSVETNVFEKKYKLSIQNYLSSINSFGNTDAVNLNKQSFSFAVNKQKLTFVQGGIYSKYNLNTTRLNVRERQLYIFENIILPSIDNFEPLLKNSEIQYYMINVGYGTKDFTEEHGIIDAEFLSVIIPKNIVNLYINSKITEKTLISNSIFYGYNNLMKSVKLITF